MRGDKIKTCLLIIIYYSLIYSILFSLNFKNTYYAKADIPFYRIPGDYIYVMPMNTSIFYYIQN